MIYLLDVNALVAFGYAKHVHYPRVIDWLNTLRGNQRTWCLATGAITELGFVRVATGPAGLASSIEQACADLKQLKEDQRVTFLGDALGAEWLPAWVRKSKQTTDGHLVQLASAWGAVLATLDTGIPGALLIPNLPHVSGVREPRLAYGVAA